MLIIRSIVELFRQRETPAALCKFWFQGRVLFEDKVNELIQVLMEERKGQYQYSPEILNFDPVPLLRVRDVLSLLSRSPF